MCIGYDTLHYTASTYTVGHVWFLVTGGGLYQRDIGHIMMNDLRIYTMMLSLWVYIDQIEPPSTKHVKPSVHAYSRVRRASSHRTARVPSSTLIPFHLLLASSHPTSVDTHHARLFSSTNRQLSKDEDEDKKGPSNKPEHPKLTHLTPTGAAHMVPIHDKQSTTRTARAVCSVHFSNPTVLQLIRENSLKKGDVLGVARIAGIMAAKRTPDLIPLCHPIMLSHVSVDLTEPTTTEEKGGSSSRIDVSATVTCDGKTGVEMEALTAAMAAALTVYDMCKAVDKGMRVEGLRVVLKEGGKSGRWVEGEVAPPPPPTESSGGKSQ